jgi:hypothetical protein
MVALTSGMVTLECVLCTYVRAVSNLFGVDVYSEIGYLTKQ